VERIPVPPGLSPEWGMTKECLASIWSLRRHAEISVWIYYRVTKSARCLVIQLERVEELDG
jgi:hypothetical protein